MFCKTIILSNSETLTSNAPKGILTLSNENNSIKGKIRLYNLISLPQSTKIGLYINENVYISTLTHRPNHYEFSLAENIDITKNIYCALIDTANQKQVILEGGSGNGFCFTDSPFDAVLEAKDEQLEQNIDKAIKESESCENCSCSNCEYKNFFYSHYSNDTHSPNHTLDSTSKTNPDCKTHFNPPIKSSMPDDIFIDAIQSNIVDKLHTELVNNIDFDISKFDNFHNNNTTASNLSNEEIPSTSSPTKNIDNSAVDDQQAQEKLEFLNDIIYQLDTMLENNPPDETLNNIIPNSRFVKVESESPYVLGVIYEDNALKYIAYGVPAQYNELPPIDFGKHYQWLPLNPRDVMSDGYFMIYQNAINGSIVEINFEE